MMKIIILSLVAFLSMAGSNVAYAQDSLKEQVWIDSVYQHMNEQERIGQLFMVAAFSGGDEYNKTEIEKLIKAHQIGGLIFMQGTPEKQSELTNTYQKTAQIPLLIGMDGEWGLGMRLTGVENYPYQMLLGATRDPVLVAEMGRQIALQCKRLGVNIDFAPVVDVNNNPKNPVINFRSFGQNKQLVTQLGEAYMRGLQENGIMACAKHFPGHGDVTVDSHKDLPVINKNLEELKNVELVPFIGMINAGVKSIMVAHLDVPALDNTPHLPTTLSKKVVTGLLKEKLGFKGLIFTDALNMKGVTKYYPDGKADLMAFLAGNDVLLFSQNVPGGIKKIQAALKAGEVSQEDLEQRVKKILKAKYEAGLNDFKPIVVKNITNDLNANTSNFWQRAAMESLTQVGDDELLLKQINVPNTKKAYLDIHVTGNQTELSKLVKDNFPNIENVTSITNLDKYDVVLVSIGKVHKYPGKDGNYGLSSTQLAQIKQLSKRKNVCFLVFGNAYLMKYLCDANLVFMAYEDNSFTNIAAINALELKIRSIGRLPVTSCHQGEKM